MQKKAVFRTQRGKGESESRNGGKGGRRGLVRTAKTLWNHEERANED